MSTGIQTHSFLFLDRLLPAFKHLHFYFISWRKTYRLPPPPSSSSLIIIIWTDGIRTWSIWPQLDHFRHVRLTSNYQHHWGKAFSTCQRPLWLLMWQAANAKELIPPESSPLPTADSKCYKHLISFISQVR